MTLEDRTSDGVRQRRLLDLLAGWEQYVSGCNEECAKTHPDLPLEEQEAESEQICLLYQKVGMIENFTNDDYLAAIREIENIVRTGRVSFTEDELYGRS